MKLKVMSFNIFCGILTEERISRVIETVNAESPDIVGIQEGMDLSVDMMKEQLGDRYEILGHGRNADKTGENCNVLYNKSVFDLEDNGTVWLSDTPEKYSYYEGSCCPRIMTYQLLKHRDSGETVLHVNTHLDHVLPNVRVLQAKALMKYIEESFGGKYPTVITGDFNCEKTEEAFSVITDASFEPTSNYGENVYTYQGFGNGPYMTIDYTFADSRLTVKSYRVCSETVRGEHPSDHSAIVSELLL